MHFLICGPGQDNSPHRQYVSRYANGAPRFHLRQLRKCRRTLAFAPSTPWVLTISMPAVASSETATATLTLLTA
jgi:hypothetical protein